jgi:acyl carrier protein
MTCQSVADVTSRVINRILTDSGRPARSLREDDTLVGALGLDSLDLAVLVVGLEQDLGVDPFRQGARPVTTFGQLVKLYESAVNEHAPPAAQPERSDERGMNE